MPLPISEGRAVPDVVFHIRRGGKWVDVTTEDLFGGKTVIAFGLPGAFTPTCSSSHVPRFNELAPLFKKLGVDDIVCFSVNDTFVMESWAKDQEANNITMIADGNGDFARGLGLLCDFSKLGFGMRSWRHSMLVRNKVIEKQFIEPEKEGDPFEVSDADTMLKYLSPATSAPAAVSLFTKRGCPFCAKAKQLLADRGLVYDEVVVGEHGVTSRSLRAVAGATTVPQVFIGGKHIGGSDDLEKYFANQN